MAFGVLSTWRVTNMARANSNLPAPETPAAPVTRTKLNSKAPPFESAGPAALFSKCAHQTQIYPSNADMFGGAPSKPAQAPHPTQLGRFLPASAFVGFMPVPMPDQACSSSEVVALVAHDTVPPPPPPVNETSVIEDAANDLDEIRTQMSDDSALMLENLPSEGPADESTDATLPSSGDEQHPLPPPPPAVGERPSEEPAADAGGHSPGSRRGAMPVRNTFIHYSIGDDREHRMVRCCSAPAVLTKALVHSKYPAMELAHIRGECRPCYYYVKKHDGCRWDGECTFCHLCPPSSLQRKKKERLKAIEAQEHIEKRRQLALRRSSLAR